jgi:dipeptidase
MPDVAGPSKASHGIGDDFFFEERGVNERNVAVSATNSMASAALITH